MTKPRTSPDSFLPLPHTSLNILLALLEGEGHGYAIKRFIEEQSQGRTRVRAGTLYEALARLERDGLIDESEVRPEAGRGTSRWRYYGISELGREVLRAELRRLAALVRFARERQFAFDSDATP